MKEKIEIIATFMGINVTAYTWDDWRQYYRPDSNWNDLMKVVEKIMQYEFKDGCNPYLRTFGMPSEDKKPMVRINRFAVHIGETLIEATFSAVVEFIEWYNQQPK